MRVMQTEGQVAATKGESGHPDQPVEVPRDRCLIVPVFERPVTSGWVYPCTVADIRDRLTELPIDDVEGLWAVGLVPATRKDCWTNARYFFSEKPEIHIYSWPESLRYTLPRDEKQSDVLRLCSAELDYGMLLESQGRRVACTWRAEDVRRFVLDHVLVHEVGHHVNRIARVARGLAASPPRRASEQFAEAYARRWAKSLRERRVT